MKPLTKTKAIIINARIHNPCAKLREVGEVAGVTREYARQVLKKHHLPTVGLTLPRYCKHCGMGIEKKRGDRGIYCSVQCMGASKLVELECPTCGILFNRSIKNTIWKVNHRHPLNNKEQERFFCSRYCASSWQGKNYGFGTHPENRGRRISIDKS